MIGESRERGSTRCRTKYTVVVGEGQRKPTVAGEAGVRLCRKKEREKERYEERNEGRRKKKR